MSGVFILQKLNSRLRHALYMDQTEFGRTSRAIAKLEDAKPTNRKAE
jgi:hypothetical protein